MDLDQKVLVVEDDGGVAELIARRLEQAGFGVLVAHSPASAAAALGREPVDLLLIDQHCGDGINGIEWYARLREVGCDIPAVVMTDDPDQTILLEALRGGCRDFLHKADGYLDLIVPTALRVTKQIATERKLDQSRTRVRKAESRQSELEDQIVKAQAAEREYREAERRRDDFLAILGHELRNPFSAIDLAVQLLGHHAGDAEEVTRLADVIGRQLSQVGRLLDDLLDLTRIRRGKITLRRRSIDLNDVIRQAAEAIQPSVNAAGHTLTVTLGEGELPADADHARLVQVLSNLLTNAVKYTPAPGHLEIYSRRDGDEATIGVRDDGTGILPDQLSRLFEPFYQIERPEGRLREGLGLGLTLVSQLVLMHGGNISAHSDGPDTGSEFLVRLPLSDSVKRQQPAPESPTSNPRMFDILVVDDHCENAEMFAAILRMMGHRTRSVCDGASALVEVERSKPEVVFSDISMPEMDGYELARRLRGLPEFGTTALIALTGLGQEGDRRDAREAGFDYHLTKPARLERLKELFTHIAERLPREAVTHG